MDLMAIPRSSYLRMPLALVMVAAGCGGNTEETTDTATTLGTTGTPTTAESDADTLDVTDDSTDPTTAGPGCGDGVVQDGEECDIGDNNGPGSMCKSDCTLNVCGDGDKGPFEGCDDGNNQNDDSCTNECKVITCVPLQVVLFGSNNKNMSHET